MSSIGIGVGASHRQVVSFNTQLANGFGEIKTSFRSKGDFNVNVFSRKHFSGGGHANAAGGMSELTLDETVIKFVSLLPEYKKQLNKK